MEKSMFFLLIFSFLQVLFMFWGCRKHYHKPFLAYGLGYWENTDLISTGFFPLCKNEYSGTYS